jgi:DNA-binding transcriptional LysR family regulator
MNLNLRQLDLNLLLVFDALMQEQNLSRAAARLHMSQPAVSNALTRLRAQLGEPLFKRTAKGMLPTPEAQRLYGPVRQALQLLQTGLKPQQAFDGTAKQLFSISMNDYGQAYLLPALLAQVRQTAPGVTLAVHDDEAGGIAARLASGDLSLAIDYIPLEGSDLCYEAFHEEKLVVIARAGHPAFAAGLTALVYQDSRHVAVHPRSGRNSPLELVLGSAKVRRQVQLFVPNYLPIPSLVAASDLLGTVPQRLAERAARSLALEIAPLPLALPAIQVSMIWHRQQDASPGLAWLRQCIVDAAGRLA